MSVRYEKIEQKRTIDLAGLGTIDGECIVDVPQVGFTIEKDADGNDVEVFEGLDVEEMLAVVEPQKDKDGKITVTAEELVVRHFNNGLKMSLRSGAYASAGALSSIKDEKLRKQVQNLKKTLDSFVKNFNMTEDQAAVQVKSIPAIAEIVSQLTELGVLKPKTA